MLVKLVAMPVWQRRKDMHGTVLYGCIFDTVQQPGNYWKAAPVKIRKLTNPSDSLNLSLSKRKYEQRDSAFGKLPLHFRVGVWLPMHHPSPPSPHRTFDPVRSLPVTDIGQ